jgi:ATP-dependent helicase HrpB
LPLPVESAIPTLAAALRNAGTAVLQAPPGAGKTTRVPLALLDEPWLGGGRIILLEPRRIAARAAAGWMAQSLGEEPGGTVGYRIRRESRVSARTRVEVVTEGILTRMLQDDPALEGFGLVIFDEFHERSLHADLGLALTLETRAVLREDLRVLVMSATLEGAPVAALLGGAPVVASEGKAWPVETRWRPPRAGKRPAEAVAAVVREALGDTEGDLLVFLPGAGEIRRVETLLAEPPVAATVLPLHGALPQAEQDRALRPLAGRKVVLATNVAETSLTIEGVRVVVDGGLARVPRHAPQSGMTRLETVRVSRASADQRRGRAGRTAPGVCYRLWHAAEDHHLLPRTTPEILEADLAALALDLALAGRRNPEGLAFLDPPPPAAFDAARSLLAQLGALDTGGGVTTHGRAMARLGLHPRLAHLLLRGRALGQAGLAADLAALLGERDLFRGAEANDADLRARVHALHAGDPRADRALLARVRDEARHLRRAIGAGERSAADEEMAGPLVALAYPDRVARRRPGEAARYLLRNGQGAVLDPQALGRAAWLACADLDGDRRESRIRLAAPMEEAEVRSLFGAEVGTADELGWDDAGRAVTARRVERLGAIVLREAALQDPDPTAVTALVVARIRGDGLSALPWSGAARLRERLAFLHALDGGWPDVSDEALLGTLEAWLGPRLAAVRRWADLEGVDLGAALLDLVPWDRRIRLDDLAPSHVVVPSGSRIAVDYADPARPALHVRVQEVFGLRETPRVGGGKVPLTLHLQSPARRPVQVTQDLGGFWRGGWADVRKELRGRYPRHDWPEDPATAAARRGTGKRPA